MIDYISKGLAVLLRKKATLCSVGACIGLASSVVLAADAGEKAAEFDDDEYFEKVKCYIPTIVSTVVTGSLIIASDRIHTGNELAIAAAATMWKDKYDKLNEKIEKELPKEEYGQLQKDIMEDKMNESEPPKALPQGCVLVYLMVTGEYVVTTKEKIAWALLHVNEILATDGRCCFSQFVTKLDGTVSQLDQALWWSMDVKEQFRFWDGMQYDRPVVKLMTDYHLEDKYNADVLYFNVEPTHLRPEEMIYYD